MTGVRAGRRPEAGSASVSVRRRILCAVFLLSGVPGLAAQLSWARVFSAGLGHEWPALVGVVTAFFVGMAAGAWILDGPLARNSRPAWWYAGLEFGCAVWIVATSFALPQVNALAAEWTGIEAGALRQTAIAFLVPFALIAPATAALGGTLPAMERAVAPLQPDGRAVALLYALNTAGAVLGVWLAMAFVMPRFGFRATLWLAAAVQLACAGGAILASGIFRTGDDRDSTRTRVRPLPKPVEAVKTHAGQGTAGGDAAAHGLSRRRLHATACWTGFLGMGFELLGVRALAQVTENTIHTYGAALGVFLAGTALGAGWLRRLERRGRAPALGIVVAVPALLCVLGGGVIGASPRLLEPLRGAAGRWGSEVVLAAAAFLLPTMGMGAVFSRVVQVIRDQGGGVGRVVAWNTLGAALAGPAAVGLLLPILGLQVSLACVSLGYLAAVPWPPGRTVLALVCLAAGATPFLRFGERLLEVPPGAEVVRFAEDRLATVAVIRTADGHRVLRVNNHFQQGGTATALAARRQGHLPLLLHPEPRRALFLGVGTGVSMGAAAAYPGLSADGVELLGAVIEALPLFEPENRAPQARPTFRILEGDARRFVRATTRRYDVIVGDLYHPAEDGAGFLYTRDHFEAVRDRLAPGGLFCQWIPLHQVTLEVFSDMARTFVEVFPGATLWLLRFNVDAPVVGLVGGLAPLRLDPAAVEARLKEENLGPAAAEVAFTSAVRVLGCLVAGPDSLRTISAGGSIATDDLPRVLFRAPEAVYRATESPAARVMTLLARADPGFTEVIGEGSAPGLADRLEAFREARDLHLRGLAREEGEGPRAAVEEYLASAAASPDYTAGYAQAVLVASAYAREDPPLARRILEELVRARPEQRLARDLLQRL